MGIHQECVTVAYAGEGTGAGEGVPSVISFNCRQPSLFISHPQSTNVFKRVGSVMTVPNSVVNRCLHVAGSSGLGGGDAGGAGGAGGDVDGAGDAGDDAGCAGGCGEDVGNGCDDRSVHAVGSPPEHKQERTSLRLWLRA